MFETKNRYRYSLDKSSRKAICPNCGKKTFVLYVDEAGNALSDEVGRCDREDKCGWHFTPSQFRALHPSNASMATKQAWKNVTKRQQPTPPSYIEANDFINTLTMYERNSLMRFLHSVFDAIVGADVVTRVATEYAVGTSKLYGYSPIYWQVDEWGNIRSGKIMGYNPATGKRVKDPRPHMMWVHSALKEKYATFHLQQCYFGAHRLIRATQEAAKINNRYREMHLNNNAEPIIWLFESEKAALIVAIALEWCNAGRLFIPIACGGCDGFNPTAEKKRDPYDGLKLLKNRKVVLFPDEGKFQLWKQKAIALNGYCREVFISTVMERNLHPAETQVKCSYEKGDALDDLILRYFAEGKNVAELLFTSYGYHGQNRIVY